MEINHLQLIIHLKASALLCCRFMRAVWTFWSKPYLLGGGLGWPNRVSMLSSWILSVELAKQHFKETELVTDTYGARLLIDGLGLEFSHISLVLDSLSDSDSDWWIQGKLLAYAEQKHSFLHIDHDVFLWNELPKNLLAADVIVQNPEPVKRGFSDWYMPETISNLVNLTQEGWLPAEWNWYVNQPEIMQTAYCTGIFGGHKIDFINYYAQLAFKILRYPGNQAAWKLLDNKMRHCATIEQYFLAACLMHMNNISIRSDSTEVRPLFASVQDAVDRAKDIGYTHLIGFAKHNADIIHRLEEKVKELFPAKYCRCVELGEGWSAV